MLDNKILALALTALIVVVGVESQVTTCGASSHQCCWVVRSWQLMGKAIPGGISSTDNSCCTKQMIGVTCDSTNTTVTKISWNGRTLSGNIPSDIGNLQNLTYL
jgi:hypothetical protein